jgi:hypothetical protein
VNPSFAGSFRRVSASKREGGAGMAAGRLQQSFALTFPVGRLADVRGDAWLEADISCPRCFCPKACALWRSRCSSVAANIAFNISTEQRLF